VILLVKIAYLHCRHPFRFRWDWHWATAARLMRLGLPILANTAVFGTLLSLDRMLILWRVPNGNRAAGLYTIAIMGTSWSLDLAGRLMLVIYPALQTTLGRTGDAAAVALQAARATEAQAPLLAAGSAVAYLVGPAFLGMLMPRYVDGLPALRPLLLGSFLLGLSWPARQALTTVDRPFRLCLASLAGLAITAVAGIQGADVAGIVGVAWGMTMGYASTALLTSATALVPTLGWRAWLGHQSRLAGTLSWYAAGALLATHGPMGQQQRWLELAARCVILTAWTVPALFLWCSKYGWGELNLRRLTWRRSS
jgi:O-antigen/teichoic acid export membrane protein